MNPITHGLRQLVLRPGLSLLVILMLALGIGATTAIFSIYNQILVQPLPVAEPHRLVNLAAPGPKVGGTYRDLAIADPDAQFSYPLFRDLEAGQTVFTGIAGHTDFVANLSFHEQPVFGRGALVSGSYFSVLDLQPALGRLIGPGDEPRIGESAVVVLSHDYWQSHFGGNPDVIGDVLTVNGHGLTIVGVAPAGFSGTALGTRAQVFVPLTLRWLMQPTTGPDHENRLSHWLYLFARLAPGVTLEQANAALNSLYSGILNEIEAPMISQLTLPEGTRERFRQRRVTLTSGARGQSYIPETAARPLTLLLVVTVLVLLIVCVNIANLLLVRGASRAGEMAIRASLGASRSRLLRQLLGESLVLVAIGALASLLVAVSIVRLVTGMLPEGLAVGLAPQLSSTALLFSAGASLLTLVVFGLVPAWRASDADISRVMKAHSSQSPGGRGAVSFRGTLTTAQIAFSMVLLVLAGLFTQSLMNVARVDLGMDVGAVVSFSITPHLNAYDGERLADLYDRVEETLAVQPGVLGVGSAGIPILIGFSLSSTWSVEGFEAAPGADTSAAYSMVGAGFFQALGIPLLAGRDFTDQDAPGAPMVAIVNESFLRKFDLVDAVGRRIGFGGTTDYPIEIVGVVADAKHDAVKNETPALLYVSRRQAAGAIQAMFFYVRAGIDPEALLGVIPRVMADIDPEVPVSNLRTMTQGVQENVYMDRMLALLSAAFAGLATLLAAVGLYGVLAYNVAQRTRELGLRLAMGAQPLWLQGLVLKQVGAMALIGVAIGLVAALGLGRVAEALLFGLSGREPSVLVAATLLLTAVVLLASYLPARRASNIAPMEALRHE